MLLFCFSEMTAHKESMIVPLRFIAIIIKVPGHKMMFFF